MGIAVKSGNRLVDNLRVNVEPDEHAPPAAVDDPNAPEAQPTAPDDAPHSAQSHVPWYRKEVHLSFPIMGLLLATIAFAVYAKLSLPY